MKLRMALVLVVLASSLGRAQSVQEKAWSVLEAGAKEKSTEKRTQAVRAMGVIVRDAKAAALAQAALDDTQPAVREAAAVALGHMRARSAIPALRKALQDKETNVVLAAADALTEMNDNAAYQLYYALLTGERKSSRGLLVDQAKILTDRKKIAELGFEQGLGFVPFAGFGYTALRAVTKDDVSPVRAEAAEALADDPDPRSGAALVQAASDKSWVVRVSALRAIAKRADAKLLPQVEGALNDDKDAVQYTAAAAIIRLSATATRAAPHQPATHK